MSERLAIHGGPQAVTRPAPGIGTWPLITDEDRQAVLGVLEATQRIPDGARLAVDGVAGVVRWMG